LCRGEGEEGRREGLREGGREGELVVQEMKQNKDKRIDKIK